MDIFDKQLYTFKSELQYSVKIPQDKLKIVATTLAIEIEENKDQIDIELKTISPIPFKYRMEELSCFQTMMETYNTLKPRPEIVRSQIITQNYVCFVYLKDTIFEVLRRNSKEGSLTKKCTKFLVNDKVRAFRNSLAHGNWMYNRDFSGIEYWANKDSNTNSLERYEVLNSELSFWQTLSRVIAYTVLIKMEEK